jgi:hypothetical protein
LECSGGYEARIDEDRIGATRVGSLSDEPAIPNSLQRRVNV